MQLKAKAYFQYCPALVVRQLTVRFTAAGFSARDALSAKAQVTGRVLSPVGDRIGFTHIAPDVQPESDTFVAVLSTVVVCMVVFGERAAGSNREIREHLSQ